MHVYRESVLDLRVRGYDKEHAGAECACHANPREREKERCSFIESVQG